MPSLFFSLAAVLIVTKLLGELARRFGQPSVLGELLAGMILGGSVLALLDPRDPAIHALSELGLFILIFQVGLHTDVRALGRVGLTALSVAVAGVVLPFVAGLFVARAFGLNSLAAIIAAASLTATSMALSARVLAGAGVLRTQEGQIVLGAALADDVIGLTILSVVVAMVAGTRVSALGIARILAVSTGFVVVGLAAGKYAVRALLRAVDAIRASASIGMFGLAFALLIAAAAAASGTAMIVGAFVAGMMLHPMAQRNEIERTTAQIGHFFVPIFFAVVGASIEFSALGHLSTLGVAAALIVVAVLGKVGAGFAAWNFSGNKLLIGTAMVPRGEVGLIFAQLGLSTGAITPAVFGAILLMVVATTFVAPPLVRAVVRRDESIDREETQETGTHGLAARRKTTFGRRH